MIRNKEVEGGVDINRNYGYKYAYDNEGSVADPCDEIYRGANAFSEPETQAVRNFVEKTGRISSAMNFHAYGNLWITPYCYYNGTDDFRLMRPEIAEFYKGFEKEIGTMGFTKSGDAEDTINYTANGEASDWMLGVHNIISFSPELGTDDAASNAFYPNKDLIPDIINTDFKVVEAFLQKNVIKFDTFKLGYLKNLPNDAFEADKLIKNRSSYDVFKMAVKNLSISQFYGLTIEIVFKDKDLAEKLKGVSMSNSGSLSVSAYDLDKDEGKLSIFNSIFLNKLSPVFVYLEMDGEINLEVGLNIIRGTSTIYSFKSVDIIGGEKWYDIKNKSVGQILLYIIWAIIVAAFIVWIICYLYKSKKRATEAAVIEIIDDVQKQRIVTRDANKQVEQL